MISKRTIIGVVVAVLLAAVMLVFKEHFFDTNINDSNTEQTSEQENSKDIIASEQDGNDSSDKVDQLKEQISKMTLQEKIGQMIMVGFEGYVIDDNIKNLIEDYKVGGVILFGRNVKDSEQLFSLNNSLKDINIKNKIPLFISVDEEGGRVSRMPSEFKKLPANKCIGEINKEEVAYDIGGILAEELKYFGFNMNFAPVLDINSNPNNPVIGDRAFGSDADIVSKLGTQTMKGIQSGGVIPVVKHFPGHGDTSEDSHLGLPSVSHSLKRLIEFELIPFKHAIDNQVDVVMAAHILLPEIDSENPSSLSKIIITDILRKELKFNGVIITDDMTMGAIVNNYNIGEAAIKSVNSGTDILLVCHDYDNETAVINALKKAVDDKSIPEERINESVYRILKLKEKYKLSDDKRNATNLKNIQADIQIINRKIDEVLMYLQK